MVAPFIFSLQFKCINPCYCSLSPYFQVEKNSTKKWPVFLWLFQKRTNDNKCCRFLTSLFCHQPCNVKALRRTRNTDPIHEKHPLASSVLHLSGDSFWNLKRDLKLPLCWLSNSNSFSISLSRQSLLLILSKKGEVKCCSIVRDEWVLNAVCCCWWFVTGIDVLMAAGLAVACIIGVLILTTFIVCIKR